MDFERAEYEQPVVLEGNPISGAPRGSFVAMPLALLYGTLAAVVGAVGYALIGLTGFMVSIVTIAIGWLVARSMMTATRGLGGRPFQVAAAVLTYLSASCGRLINLLYALSKEGVSLSQVPPLFMLRFAITGPFQRFADNPFWAAMGLLILFYGLRTAWQIAAGSPGFGQPGGPRMGAMGLR